MKTLESKNGYKLEATKTTFFVTYYDPDGDFKQCEFATSSKRKAIIFFNRVTSY